MGARARIGPASSRRAEVVAVAARATIALGLLVPSLAEAQSKRGRALLAPSRVEAVGASEHGCSRAMEVERQRAGASEPRPAPPRDTRRFMDAAASRFAAGDFADAGPCSAAEFAALDGAQLAEAVAASSRGCLLSLWSFDADVARVVSSAHVDAVATQIVRDASDVVANASRLDSLFYYLQAAYVHAFAQPTITYSDDLRGRVGEALVWPTRDVRFTQDGALVEELRTSWILTLAATQSFHHAAAPIEALLVRFHARAELAARYWERVAVTLALDGVAREIFSLSVTRGDASPWVGRVDHAFAAAVRNLALEVEYDDSTLAVVEEALFVAVELSRLDAAAAGRGHAILTDAYDLHDRLSAPWLLAVLYLEAAFEGALAGGGAVDLEEVREEVARVVLPNTFVFDGGRITFRMAGDLDQAWRLYDALQEVEAQFFRKTTFLDPVVGDGAENLTLVVYGSRGDYVSYQPLLTGLPTANGGIYIERDATLYTFDRTASESAFTLDEIVRHEYVHYLSARHLVAGGFYAPGSLYVGGRLDWFEEGLAEFLAGSTRLEGALPRLVNVADIGADPVYMSVGDVLDSRYAHGFGFYPYAGALFGYLASSEPARLAELFDGVRSDSGTRVDAVHAELRGAAAVDVGFQAYLSGLVAAAAGGGGRFAEEVDASRTPARLPANNAVALQQAVAARLAPAASEFVSWPDRFQYRSYIGPGSVLASALGRRQLEAELDLALAELEALDANFASAVAWFGRFSGEDGLSQAAVVIEAAYLGGHTHPAPPPFGAVTTDANNDIPGDANDDGAVTVTDALEVLFAVTSAAACRACICDVDGNGRLSVADAFLILLAAIGRPVDLVPPVCGQAMAGGSDE